MASANGSAITSASTNVVRPARSSRAARVRAPSSIGAQKSAPVTSQRRVGAHEVERQIAGAAAQIEDTAAVRRGQLRDRALAPAFIRAGGEELVRRVVARCDFREHFADIKRLVHSFDPMRSPQSRLFTLALPPLVRA